MEKKFWEKSWHDSRKEFLEDPPKESRRKPAVEIFEDISCAIHKRILDLSLIESQEESPRYPGGIPERVREKIPEGISGGVPEGMPGEITIGIYEIINEKSLKESRREF